MAWTTEKRYKRYEDWTQEELQHIKENIAKSPWRANYHVEPQTGLLNDPNGFLISTASGWFSTKTFLSELLTASSAGSRWKVTT